MIRYTRYLFINILSKRNFWLGIFVSIAVTAAIGILWIKGMNDDGDVSVDRIIAINKFIPFIFSTILTCLLIIYIFKNGELDGTELMIVSKPIGRREIVLGKYIVLFSMLFLIQILFFITILSFAQYDKYAIPIERLKFAAALVLGSTFSQMVIAPAFSFLALLLGRVGILTIGSLTATIIPVASLIMVPTAGGAANPKLPVRDNLSWDRSLDYDTVEKFSNDFYAEFKKTNVLTGPDIYEKIDERLDYKNRRSSLDVNVPQFFNKKSDRRIFKTYKEDVWYEKVAPFDLWYQWGVFYETVIGKSITKSSVLKWTVEKNVINLPTSQSVDPSDPILSKVFLIVHQNTLNSFKSDVVMNVARNAIDGKIDSHFYIEDGNNFRKATVKEIFTNRKLFWDNAGKRELEISFEERFNSISSNPLEKSIASYQDLIVYKTIVNALKESGEYVSPLWSTIENRTAGHNDGRKMEINEVSSKIIVQGDEVLLWVVKPWIKGITRIIIFIIFSISLLIGSVIVWLKRDFK